MSKKASNIAVLHRRGVDVPRGFCLDASHYKAATAPVRDALVDAAGNGAAMRKAFCGLVLPEKTLDALNQGMEVIPCGSRLAVRSSGNIVSRGQTIKEDSSEVSLAGQFDSFLNVSRDNVQEAVRQCWASLFNDRSVEVFRADAGYVNNSTMAVIVQEMVPADASAVVMTVDPLGDGMVGGMELTVGPCEAIVSGVVNPDEIIFNRNDGSVIQRRVGMKQFSISYGPFARGSDNCVRTAVSQERRQRLAVADAVLNNVIDIVRRIEGIFGVPQDIELIIDRSGKVTVVQARSITCLPDHYVPFGQPSV